MKKRYFNGILLITVVLVLSFSVFTPKSVATGAVKIKTSANEAVTLSQKADSTKVLESRFLNMLNHNYVYGTNFRDNETIVNNSVVALLAMRDKQNDSYIAENYVKDFVFNMYGVVIDDFSEINASSPKLDGFVYIIPCGVTKYNHTINSVTLNEDGTYTVVTKVTIDAHDSEAVEVSATSLFVKNEASQFGYNIISSNISGNLNDL